MDAPKATNKGRLALSVEPLSQFAEDDSAHDEASSLAEKLKAVAAERDRHASDKVELIARASELSKECENLRAQLAAAVAERGDLRAKLAEAATQGDAVRDELAAAIRERDRYADEAVRAGETIGRLERQIAETPSADPVSSLTRFAASQTAALVEKTRAAIPPEHPARAWFDRTVSAAAAGGRATAEAARWLAPRLKEAYAWAAPRARELYAAAKTQIRERLAKKQ